MINNKNKNVEKLNLACERLRNLENELINIQNQFIIGNLDHSKESNEILNDISKIESILIGLTSTKIPNIINKFERKKDNFNFINRENNFNKNNVFRNNGQNIGNQNVINRKTKIRRQIRKQEPFNPVVGIEGINFDAKNNKLIPDQNNMVMQWVAEGYNNYDAKKSFDPYEGLYAFGVNYDNKKNKFIPANYNDPVMVGLAEGLNGDTKKDKKNQEENNYFNFNRRNRKSNNGNSKHNNYNLVKNKNNYLNNFN